MHLKLFMHIFAQMLAVVQKLVQKLLMMISSEDDLKHENILAMAAEKSFWIRQYPYNSLTFARKNILATNFAT